VPATWCLVFELCSQSTFGAHPETPPRGVDRPFASKLQSMSQPLKRLWLWCLVGNTLRVGGATADAAAQLTCMTWPRAMVGTTLEDLKRMRVA
jgi:hypothetical protein